MARYWLTENQLARRLLPAADDALCCIYLLRLQINDLYYYAQSKSVLLFRHLNLS